MVVQIVIEESDWQFLDKEEPEAVEVINIKSKKKFEGKIKSITSSGKYYIELGEEIKGL